MWSRIFSMELLAIYHCTRAVRPDGGFTWVLLLPETWNAPISQAPLVGRATQPVPQLPFTPNVCGAPTSRPGIPRAVRFVPTPMAGLPVLNRKEGVSFGLPEML